MCTPGDGPATPRGKNNLGFVELPDHALDLLSHYTQSEDWEVVLVVSRARDTDVMRMAEILQIPTMEAPERLPLLSCSRVIVGDQPSNIMDTTREVLEGSAVEIVPLEQALTEVRSQATATDAAAAPLDPAAWSDLLPSMEQQAAGAEPQAEETEQPAAPVELAPQPEPAQFEAPPQEEAGGDTQAEASAEELRGEPVVESPPAAEPEPVAQSEPDHGSTPTPAEGIDALRGILQRAIAETLASGGAFFLPDGPGGQWRAVAREGISPENAEAFDQRLGEVICREVYVSGVPRITHRNPEGAPESWAEFASPEAAAIGITQDAKVIGILAVVAETPPVAFDDESVLLLARSAREAAGILSRIVGEGADTGDRWQEALIEVDQFMASPENLGARLRGVADALGRTLAADFARLFLVDPLSRRLSLAGAPEGVASWQPLSQPLDRGFLGAMIRIGEVHIAGMFQERGERRAALVCVPIQAREPRALIVLENIPVPAESEEQIFRLLREVVSHTEELIATEEGVVAQELLYQLKMRVTDQIPQLAALPPVQRTRAALELALQNLAAEVAIWVPANKGRPISTEPRSPKAISILGQVRWSLDRIAQWVTANGPTAVGLGAEEANPEAPAGPAPYIGVVSPDGEGVLVTFFPPDEVTGSPAQVPVHVLIEVGHHISELCSPRFTPGMRTAPVMPAAIPQPDILTDQHGFRLLTRQEWLRSRRYGHAFALTRLRFTSPPSEETAAALRSFLLARKRDVDFLTEREPGACVLLSPEVDENPEGIRERMLREWGEAHPDLPIEADQRIFPRDGQDESVYLTWADGSTDAQRAA